MTTITLTPQPEVATVDILLEAITTVPVRIFRTDRNGIRVELRGSPFTATVGSSLGILDAEAPFGDLLYEVGSPTVEASASTSLDVDVPWLTHPLAPFLSVPVKVEDDTEWQNVPRTFLYDVIDRSTPVYTWYKRQFRSGLLTIEYANSAQRTAIRDVLITGAPMLIRYPVAYDQFETGYYGFGDVRTVPRGVGSREGHFELQYAVVEAPPGVSSGTALTWDLLATTEDAWSDVMADYASWYDVLTDTVTVGPFVVVPGQFGT